MGTISEKLTYLNDTKGLLKNNINLTGAGLTNQTPFRQYATDLKTALLNILNNGIDTLYNNFPKTTGTGTNISLNNTLQAPIRSVINGDTEQDGEPTPDNPKEIKSVTGLQKVGVCGKNLISTNEFTLHRTNKRTIQIDFATPLPAGTYTISWKIASQSGLTSTAPMGWAIYGGSTNLGSLPQIYDGITTTSSTKTTTQQITHLYAYINSSAPSDATITIENLQLEYGSTATTYEAYQSQEYEINLGKNLLKFPYTESSLTRDGITYTINNDGSIKINGTATATSFIDLYRNTSVNLLEKGNTYTYSISPENSNIRLTILERYNNTWNDNGFGTNKITFTISNNSEGQLIRLIVTNGSTINTTISPLIEEGSEATSYSPYFTPIHLYEGDQIIGTPYNWNIYKENGVINSYNGETITTDYISTTGGLDIGAEVIYKLTTPTTTPITNTELIENLNNFYNAKSYNGQTNISVEGDLPMILDVSAIIGD